MFSIILLAYSVLWGSTAHAIPQLTEDARMAAMSHIQRDNEHEAFGRLLIAISAVEEELDENTLFAMASTHPHIVVMIMDPLLRAGIDYLISIPAAKRNRLRRGDTILRTMDDMSKPERKRAYGLLEQLGISPKNLNAIRIGAFEKTAISLEVTSKIKRTGMKQTYVSLAKPNMPVHNETTRNRLTVLFGARPGEPERGQYTHLGVQSPSFESVTTLQNEWGVGTGLELGAAEPVGTVQLDSLVHLDGLQSIHFYNTDKTRTFPSLVQWVPVGGGESLHAQVFVKTENLRTEFQQQPDGMRMLIQLYDNNSQPLGEPHSAIARLGTYDWEALQLTFRTPPNTTVMRVEMLSALSGKSWVDALTIRKMR